MAAGLQAAIGSPYSASLDAAGNLVISRTDGNGFKVALVVTAAQSSGTMSVSGTPLYYSTAKIHLTGPVNSGETWTVTLNSTPYPYVVQASNDLDAVGAGLDAAIGNAFDAGYNASTKMLAITASAGVQVASSIIPATVDGSATASGTKAYTAGVTIGLGSIGTTPVPKNDEWTVTINGNVYRATSTGNDGKTVDQMGSIWPERLITPIAPPPQPTTLPITRLIS